MRQILFISFMASVNAFFVLTSYSEVVEEREKARVFGQNLFTGGFKESAFQGFNPNYVIGVGDIINLQLWGGYEVTTKLTVDAQGNLFIPNIGPVRLQGVTNKDLNKTIAKKVASVYQRNVKLYASLDASQPVQLYVTGFVKKPGLYGGLSSDSILSYLEKSGGITPESGSYLRIQLKRDNTLINEYNLYDFILTGHLKQQQLHDGDVLVVGARQSNVSFDGLVENAVEFEFEGDELLLSEALATIGLLPEATHARITRGNRLKNEVEYIPLNKKETVALNNGDTIDIVSDKPTGTIVVFVEGEHKGRAEYVLPYGADLDDLIKKIQVSENSLIDAMQLYREEVAARQKEMIELKLQKLEDATYSARSSTEGVAKLRASDAKIISEFIKRARDIEPLGLVVMGNNPLKNSLTLKNRDRLFIPSKNLLIQVNGEVMFPSATVWRKDATIYDYIEAAGGFTQKSGHSRVLVIKQNGEIINYGDSMGKIKSKKSRLSPGDEVLVLPQIDNKTMQFAMDLSQIIYQIALTARVALLL